jgi:hypothetical protein
MTFGSPLAVDVSRRERSRRVWQGAIITSAFIAAGVALATTILPAAPTPANVARAYVEALLTDDWAGAWALLCRPTRSDLLDYPTFVERTAYLDGDLDMPSDVEVSVGDVHGVRGTSRPFAAVAFRATSDERNREDWEISGELFLVEEGGAFRVCDQGLRQG